MPDSFLKKPKDFYEKSEIFEKKFHLLKDSNLVSNDQIKEIEKFFKKKNKIKKELECLEKDLIPLNVAIVGEFSSGKSSIVNSILEDEIVPTGDEPMTSVVSIFKYGDEKYIEAEVDNEKRILTKDEFLLIKHGTEKEANEKLKIDVDKIEKLVFYYPNPLLNKIHIIDTPGFSTANKEGDDEKTMRTIEKDADILFWTIDINQGTINETSLKRIQNIRKDKPNLPIFIIVNKVDSKGKPSSEKVVNILNEIKNKSKVDKVYPYSATQILKAQKEGSSTETVLKKIEQMINKNSFPILLDKKQQKKIRRIEEKIEITYSDEDGLKNIETIQLKNFSEWIKMKKDLLNELMEIRDKSKNYEHFSLSSEIEELFNFSENLLKNIEKKLSIDLDNLKNTEENIKKKQKKNQTKLEEILKKLEREIFHLYKEIIKEKNSNLAQFQERKKKLFPQLLKNAMGKFRKKKAEINSESQKKNTDLFKLSENVWNQTILPELVNILNEDMKGFKKEIEDIAYFIEEDNKNFLNELKESYYLFINLILTFVDEVYKRGVSFKDKNDLDKMINKEYYLHTYLKNSLEKYFEAKYSLTLEWINQKKEEIKNIKEKIGEKNGHL